MTDELKRLQMVAECKQLEPQQMSKLTLLRCGQVNDCCYAMFNVRLQNSTELSETGKG